MTVVVVEVARTDDRLQPMRLVIDGVETEYESLHWMQFAGRERVDIDVDFGDGRAEYYQDVGVRDAV